MARYIDADLLIQEIKEETPLNWTDSERELQEQLDYRIFKHMVDYQPTANVAEVRRGEWVLTAHKERTNYRWKVTARCSECNVEEKEIYSGLFPNYPDDMAKEIILNYAKNVKLSNFCPNCGAKMIIEEEV